MSARLLDEAINLRQAQSGTLADLLSREKGIKGLSQNLLGHSGAVVGDREEYILAGNDFLMIARIGIIEKGVGRLDRQPAAIRHGVARVEREVDDRIFELAAVRRDHPETAGEHRLDRNRLTQRPPQQLGHARDQAV